MTSQNTNGHSIWGILIFSLQYGMGFGEHLLNMKQGRLTSMYKECNTVFMLFCRYIRTVCMYSLWYYSEYTQLSVDKK